MPSPLQAEFDYYLAHQADLVERYRGRVIVIKDQQVIGDYENESDAIAAAQKDGHKLGTFLVQNVEPGDVSYTQTFHSRVAIG